MFKRIGLCWNIIEVVCKTLKSVEICAGIAACILSKFCVFCSTFGRKCKLITNKRDTLNLTGKLFCDYNERKRLFREEESIWNELQDVFLDETENGFENLCKSENKNLIVFLYFIYTEENLNGGNLHDVLVVIGLPLKKRLVVYNEI